MDTGHVQSPCQPRRKWARQQQAAEEARQQVRQQAADKHARETAAAEQRANADRPKPLFPVPPDWPDEVGVRFVHYTVPGGISVERDGQRIITVEGPDDGDWNDSLVAIEAVLAALGYELDRFRLYTDMGLTVAKFHRAARDG